MSSTGTFINDNELVNLRDFLQQDTLWDCVVQDIEDLLKKGAKDLTAYEEAAIRDVQEFLKYQEDYANDITEEYEWWPLYEEYLEAIAVEEILDNEDNAGYDAKDYAGYYDEDLDKDYKDYREELEKSFEKESRKNIAEFKREYIEYLRNEVYPGYYDDICKTGTEEMEEPLNNSDSEVYEVVNKLDGGNLSKDKLTIYSFQGTSFRKFYNTFKEAYCHYFDALSHTLFSGKTSSSFNFFYKGLILLGSCDNSALLTLQLLRDFSSFHSDERRTSLVGFLSHCTVEAKAYLSSYLAYGHTQYISQLFSSQLLPGFFSLPVKKKLFTILRSPHTDKKSREQFTFTSLKRGIVLPVGYIDTFLPIWKYFTNANSMVRLTTFK